MSRVRFTPSGLMVLDMLGNDQCGQRMSPEVDGELFGLAQQAHQHFVDILERTYKRPTPTLEESFQKRLFLYLGTLLNDSIGAVLLLVSHDNLRMTQPITRSAYEYALRSLYYSYRKKLTFDHFVELWPKAERLWRSVPLDPRVSEQIDELVKRFAERNPEWKRPPEATGPKSFFEEMYGERRGQRLYHRWHRFYSPFVHGTFDGVMMVLAHDGHNTVVQPGPDIANIALAEITRIAFAMMALLKRVFSEHSEETLKLFRQYVRRRESLRLRVQSQFPRPRRAFIDKHT